MVKIRLRKLKFQRIESPSATTKLSSINSIVKVDSKPSGKTIQKLSTTSTMKNGSKMLSDVQKTYNPENDFLSK